MKIFAHNPAPLDGYTSMKAYNVKTKETVRGWISGDKNTLRIDVFSDLDQWFALEKARLTDRPLKLT
jgi:hypothetical protein